MNSKITASVLAVAIVFSVVGLLCVTEGATMKIIPIPAPSPAANCDAQEDSK